MDHEAGRVEVVDLVFVWELAVLGVHGKVQICILLLLRVDHDVLAILTE